MALRSGARSRILGFGLWVVFVGGLLSYATGSASAGPPLNKVTEYPVPTPSAYPYFLAGGRDGNVWFTESGVPSKVGQITPAGAITEFPLPNPNSNLSDITSGPDGNLWFVETSTDTIGMMTPSGQLSEFPLPPPAFGTRSPRNITMLATDGALWFTEDAQASIGRITTSGTVTEFPVQLQGSFGVQGLAAGPDGNIWFTDCGQFGSGASQIGRLDPSNGNLTEFPVPTAQGCPYGITAGPEGNLWFTEKAADKVGRITPQGQITEFPLPAGNTPLHIVSFNGSLWATQDDAQLAEIDTSGNVIEHDLGTVGAIWDLAAGPDGNLWFTEPQANQIGTVVAPGSKGGGGGRTPSPASGACNFAVSNRVINQPVNYYATCTYLPTNVTLQAADMKINWSLACAPPVSTPTFNIFGFLPGPVPTINANGVFQSKLTQRDFTFFMPCMKATDTFGYPVGTVTAVSASCQDVSLTSTMPQDQPTTCGSDGLFFQDGYPPPPGAPSGTLVVTKSGGSGSGNVRSNPSGIDCGANCSAKYGDGTQVTLTASATVGDSFSGWSGACSGTAITCTVAIHAGQTTSVNARFDRPTRTLTVQKQGTGSGNVRSLPSIDCGVTCSASYTSGMSVTLTESPTIGSVFAGWGGACSGTLPTCTVVLDSDKTVLATFNVGSASLSVSTTGSGSVTSTPAAVFCPGTCSTSFPAGTPVQLNASPIMSGITDYEFSGWGGDCSGTGPCDLIMSADRHVTATFTPIDCSANEQYFIGRLPNKTDLTQRTAFGVSEALTVNNRDLQVDCFTRFPPPNNFAPVKSSETLGTVHAENGPIPNTPDTHVEIGITETWNTGLTAPVPRSLPPSTVQNADNKEWWMFSEKTLNGAVKNQTFVDLSASLRPKASSPVPGSVSLQMEATGSAGNAHWNLQYDLGDGGGWYTFKTYGTAWAKGYVYSEAEAFGTGTSMSSKVSALQYENVSGNWLPWNWSRCEQNTFATTPVWLYHRVLDPGGLSSSAYTIDRQPGFTVSCFQM